MRKLTLILIGLTLLVMLTACGPKIDDSLPQGDGDVEPQGGDTEPAVNTDEVADDAADEIIDENEEIDVGDVI